MKDTMDMELVVRIEGGVQETNLEEFQKRGLELIKGINLDPQTDDDYARAEAEAKNCKAIEDRIKAAQEEALSKVDDIQSLFSVMDNLHESFRKTRLILEKKVKAEKATRRKRIIDGGIGKIREAISGSLVSHAPFGNYSEEILQAIKGKKKIESIQEAVDEIVGWYLDDVTEKEQNWNENYQEIEKQTEDYPGLFPDAKDVALKTRAEVASEIAARTASFRLKQAEKEKAESERKMKRMAEKKVTEAAPDLPAFDAPPDFDLPGEVTPIQNKVATEIVVVLEGTDDEIQTFIDSIINQEVVSQVKLNPYG